MTILLACMSEHHVHVRCPRNSEEGAQAPGAGVMDTCECHVAAGN